MADLFNRSDAEYQTDEKWYALVEEEDRVVVGASPSPTGPGLATPDMPEGFVDVAHPPGEKPGGQSEGMTPGNRETPPAPPRQKLHELSRIYKHPLLKVEFNVEAFLVDPSDPDLPRKAPWTVKLEDPGTRTFLFLFDPDHAVFRSVTMTPIDALLDELAFKTYEFLKDTSPASAVLATILADLRNEYATDGKLDSKEIIAQANGSLREIGLCISRNVEAIEYETLFERLPERVREAVRRKVASSGATSLQSVILNGEFLTYAEPNGIREFVCANPEIFFDGKFWDQPYRNLDYGSDSVNEEARGRVVERYGNYLADAAWLASQSPRDLDRSERDELIRATLSLRLIRPDGVG